MAKHTPIGPSQRQLRVGEEIRHALAWIIERGELRHPDLADATVTVTEVRISPDLRQATVFITPFGDGDISVILAALEKARGFLRRRVADAVKLRHAPDLTFRADESFDEADRISEIFRHPRVAQDIGAGETTRDSESDEEHENGS